MKSIRKETCIQFAKFILTRNEYQVFSPVTPVGYDLLACKDAEYYKVLVLSINAEKPIVALKSTSKGRASIRDFDILLCIHPETLATWQLPAADVPEKETLYLSERYDSYKVSFITIDMLTKATPVLYEKARMQTQELALRS